MRSHLHNNSNKTKTLVMLLVLAILLLLCAIMGIVLFSEFYEPNVDTDIPFDTDAVDAGYVPDVGKTVGEFTRKDGVYNIMVIGKDKVALNTDVMMIVQIDSKEKSASVLQLPRDTYFNGHKLNAVYAEHYLSANSTGLLQEAVDGLRKDVEKALCVKVDFTVLLTLEAFEDIINLIGGVTVDVPFDMKYSDPVQGLYIDLKKGTQRLDGETAMEFIRYRSGYIEGDLGRINATKLFLSSMLAQLKESIDIKILPSLISTVFENVTTTMSVLDIGYFAELVLEMDLENVKFITLPGLDVREYGDTGKWFYIARRADCIKAVNEYINVYNSPVTESMFDRNTALCDTLKDSFSEIYYSAPSESLGGYVASDIVKDGIDIEHY